MDTLRDIPLFSDMPDEMLGMLSPLVGEERLSEGEEIFAEGSVSDRFFIVKEGEVEIRKSTEGGEGRYKLIAVLQAGEFFGEMAVFLDELRTATAVAKTGVTLLTIGRKDLLEMFSKSPEAVAAFRLMGSFTSVIMGRLRDTTDELVTVYETGRLITSVKSMDELAGCALESVIDAIGSAEAGIFVTYNEFNDDYEVYGQRGIELEPGTVFDDEDPILGLLLERGEPFVSFDLENDGRFPLGDDTLYRGHSLLAAPFIVQGRLLGFMLLMNRSRLNAFSYNQMVLLSAISGYVSVSLENMQYMQAEIDRTRLEQGKSTIQPF